VTVYISGPVSNIENYNREAFQLAEDYLQSLGHFVINPTKEVQPDAKKTWIDYMRIDVGLLLRADAIYMLPGWQKSKGAKLEWKIARELEYKVFFHTNC